MRLFALILAALLPLALLAQPPEPESLPISILASPQVALGDWVAIRVETAGKGRMVRVYRVQPGQDELLDRGLLELADGGYALVAAQGTYRIEALAIEGEQIVSAEAVSVIGEPKPPPDPITPIVPGARWVVLIRETADSTPQMAAFITGLRNSETQKYADSKGHKILVLDDDSKTPLGLPLPEMQAWLAELRKRNVSLPALLVVDPSHPAGAGVLSAGSVPKTSDEVLAKLKASGG